MLYVTSRHAEARSLAQLLEVETPDDVQVRGFIATAALRLGDRETAAAAAEWLRNPDPRHRFGCPEFVRAKIAALQGDSDEAFRLLREAFAQHSVSLEDFSW